MLGFAFNFKHLQVNWYELVRYLFYLQWYPEIREHCANTAVILCGCQVDLRTDKQTVAELSLVFKSPVTSEQVV